jgi:hypothetical protein
VPLWVKTMGRRLLVFLRQFGLFDQQRLVENVSGGGSDVQLVGPGLQGTKTFQRDLIEAAAKAGAHHPDDLRLLQVCQEDDTILVLFAGHFEGDKMIERVRVDRNCCSYNHCL